MRPETLSEACAELNERWGGFTKALGGVWRETMCLITGHQWRCLGRWNSGDYHDASNGPSSSISAWECSRCGKTEVQQWDW